MNGSELAAVTGAFGYTGKYITKQLLTIGKQVITFTGHMDRPNEFGDRVKVYPFDFNQPNRLVEHLKGVHTFYNTYWVRFDHGKATYEQAIANTRILIEAAKHAGVQRFVHVSITNPSTDSTLPYFRGKALLESAIKESGLSYAIVRPTVVFGNEDILINNIAYLLRRFPVFIVPGRGDYRLQPIYVEDLAQICIQVAKEDRDEVIDAIGPQIVTFNELVTLIKKIVGSQARILHMPERLVLPIVRLMGAVLGDVVITREEIAGLSADLLISSDRPTGKLRLDDWLYQNRERVGVRYASELKRHYVRV